MFAGLKRRFQLNKHHMDVLRKSKSIGKVLRYLATSIENAAELR